MGNMCCGDADDVGKTSPTPSSGGRTWSSAPPSVSVQTPSPEERRAQMAAAAAERERKNATRGTQRET